MSASEEDIGLTFSSKPIVFILVCFILKTLTKYLILEF